MSEAIKVMTGVGRIVQGHPMTARERTDRQTKAVKLNADGTPMVQYFCSLAFPKSDPEFAATVYPALAAAAQRDWPRGEFQNPRFAWKWFDADTARDESGKLYSEREGMAGCYVLKVATSFEFPVVDENGARLTDPSSIKTGDYARAYIGVKGNGPSQSPGIYVNPDFLQRCGRGEAISSGPDVAGVLAQVGAFKMPAGASLQPHAPNMVPAVGQPAAAPAPMQPAAAPAPMQPAAAPAPMQPAAIQPHPGILNPPQ